jgi:hypothetical protein
MLAISKCLTVMVVTPVIHKLLITTHWVIMRYPIIITQQPKTYPIIMDCLVMHPTHTTIVAAVEAIIGTVRSQTIPIVILTGSLAPILHQDRITLVRS